MRRRAYTLLEMLVVLAILGSLVALSWPALRDKMDKAQLHDAAKLVAVELTRARLTAIESGLAREFHFEPGGTHYEVAPHVIPGDPATEALLGTPAVAPASEFQLPEGVTFAVPLPSDSPLDDVSTTPAADGDWAPPLLFQPSGRSTNARIRLLGQQQMFVEVELRGLTGTARVGQIQRGEEP